MDTRNYNPDRSIILSRTNVHRTWREARLVLPGSTFWTQSPLVCRNWGLTVTTSSGWCQCSVLSRLPEIIMERVSLEQVLIQIELNNSKTLQKYLTVLCLFDKKLGESEFSCFVYVSTVDQSVHISSWASQCFLNQTRRSKNPPHRGTFRNSDCCFQDRGSRREEGNKEWCSPIKHLSNS